ncbi:DNA polymerase III subunit gamma/tau [Salipaludibacillus agaradhaerens]|uniref:DNA-directed DNA polymerase n=1 Tax=Salipaludibacillus agaradhaerens TaxID=76935 RepID=A0A9Q4B5S2_SALAG|nr:DNA polymerase III subunit gamma/tau [Salipaludibacillus agaradhaerens]MCR6098440.1 DNA polymerase III subunit gamma/tau [Salipaludibacillus agaradhaerens]MCR6115930.1 DNA polymerase III subunit gamma/tau [Salipaludibacillus agaradhaerens]
MSYQALYRVWRPTQLTDVVGQEHITKTLKNALLQEKLSHAYLFTGPRGTGKTSAAKIISKSINCEKAPVDEPCNECATCKGIQDGSIVDVMEIDAASNNGVDEIRDIRDKVKFAPSAARYKVYIIDEVHMLSTGAFNALLKTLEEPPPHVIFILATTEPHKIPLTIISRCQRFDFKRISAHAMLKRMEEILESSDVQVDEDALALIARASEGGMRDALSLLDQAISYADETVTQEDVLSIIGAVSQQLLYRVIEAIYSGDVADGLQAVDELMKEGKDPNRFVEDLIFFLRDVLMVKAAPDLDESKDRLTGDDAFKQVVESLDIQWIYQMIESLNHFQQQMKWASHPQVFLEILIVQSAQKNKGTLTTGANANDENEAIKTLQSKIDELEASIKHLQKSGVTISANGSTSGESKPKPKPKSVPNSTKSREHAKKVKGMLHKATKQHLQTIHSSWGQVIEEVKQKSVPASAWLNDCKPVACSDNQFVLAFRNEMHRDMVDEKFRELVEEAATVVTQHDMTMLTILEPHWEEVKAAYVREQKVDGTTEGASSSSENSKEEANPVIDEAVKLVGRDLLEIKD